MSLGLLLLVVFFLIGFENVNGSSARLVAVGDVHGDLPQLKAVLQLSELVDKTGAWVGGAQTLVQVGDLIDRGPDDVAVLRYMKTLQGQAREAGGDVVLLLGNHELMNLEYAFHYVHPDSMSASGGSHARKELFSPDGELGKFIHSFNLTHVAHGCLFVHAGLDPSFAREGLEKLEEKAATALASGNLRASVFGQKGPVWTRLLVNEATVGRCDRVEATLNMLSLDRMVVGHTPQRGGHLETYCDDTLIAVDVGMSKWMYGHLAALELTVNDQNEVEMREITGRSISEAEEEQSSDSQEATLDTALNDAHLLQEMMEAVQEASAPTEKKDEL